MRLPINRFWLAAAVLTLAAMLAACSGSGSSSGESSSLLRGVLAEEAEGLNVSADPEEIVIDLGDPGSPTDPDNAKRYEETTLTALVLDDLLNPVFEAEVLFSTTAGVLASGGTPILTDDQGIAEDTLRVFEDDPEEIVVTVTSGAFEATITIPKSVLVPNQPPVANAGDDISVDCVVDGDTTVTLDGSGSTDPDSTPDTNDDIVLFEWFVDFGLDTEVKLGEGETFDQAFDVGMHIVTLRVTDSEGETDTDEVTVEVRDDVPPLVDLMLDPSELWPPNHSLVSVHATVDVTDCSPVTVILESVTSNEPDNGIGDGNHEPDIVGADPGTEDYDFKVRAERSGTGIGRTYTVEYRVTDAGGLETLVAATVRVPHDQGP